MADSKCRKRQHAVDTTEKHDVIKIANTEESSDTYFDRSNVDCLEHIFDFLGPIDLLNVAQLNPNATKAAEIVYARRYSEFLVKLYINGGKLKRNSTFFVQNSIIYIYTSSGCKMLVQQFGKFFNSMEMLGGGHYECTRVISEWQEALQMINKECGKHVTNLIFSHANRDVCNEFQRVFEKVETIIVNQTRMGHLKNHMKKWFPSLKQLEMNGIDPLVAKALIASSPHLKSLEFKVDGDGNILHLVNEFHPMLKELKVSWPYMFHQQPNQTQEKILFKNVEKFTIHLNNNLSPMKFPFRFERLTDLMVEMNERTDILFNVDNGAEDEDEDEDEEIIEDEGVGFEIEDEDQVAMAWIDFASEQVELIKLQLDMRDFEIPKDNLSKLTDGLTKLNELELLAKLNFEDVAYILSRCKSLQTLKIDSPNKEVHDLCANLSDRWIIEENESLDFMSFKRKLTQ